MSGATREISTSSRHGSVSPRRKTSVIQKAKSSPEVSQRFQEKSCRLVRRKGISANVKGSDDSDLCATQSIGNAGLVRPPAEMQH